MANWKPENTVLTSIGLQMLAKAQVGIGKLQITKIVTSDTVSTPANNRNMVGNSSTIPYKQECVLMRVNGGKADSGNPAIDQNVGVSQITARVSNEDITDNTVYGVRQIIVFMRLIDLTDPNEDMGEVPYMVAQSEGADDYDFIPPFSSNPTAINYDLFILHAGVATIDISVKTAGYVDDDEFNEFKTEITNIVNNIIENEVGQNTKGMTFQAWKPQYTGDVNEGESRVWSKSPDTIEVTGTKSAERFNCYEENNNIATGENCHVEGLDNVSINSDCTHLEGSENCIDRGENGCWCSHIEGRRNYVTEGWFQHIEGENNQSTGYCSHIEGRKHKNDSYLTHIEGDFNTASGGRFNHIEGSENTVYDGFTNYTGGCKNISNGSSATILHGNQNITNECLHSFISGSLNTVQASESIVSGTNNGVSVSTGSIVSGSLNSVSNSDESAILGSNNTTKNINNSSVLGLGNNATDSNNTSVSGESNTLQDTLDSEIIGKSNNIHTDPSNTNTFGIRRSVVSGLNNDVTRTADSVITGNNNSVHDYSPSYTETWCNVVSGSDNVVKGLYSSVLTGFKNEVSNIRDSLISGKENTIFSEVPAGGTNCVLCSGYKCTVDSKGFPVFITGSFNESTANNTSVMGANNIASSSDQVVMGHYNVEDTQNRFALIVGGGDKNGENVARKNILELDWFGNLHIAALYTSDIYNDDGSNKFNAWNIADGTGERSIVANDIANNHATAPYTMSVGFNTEATQDYAFASGLQSKAQGRASATFGWLNESTGAYSFTAGSQNKVKGENSSGFGFNNSIDSNSTGSMAIGSNNNLESSNWSLTVGMANTSSGMYTATFGSNNTNKGNANLISGANCSTDTSCINNAVFGAVNKVLSGVGNSLISGASNTISSGSNVAIIASSECTIDSEGYGISNVAIIGGKKCTVKSVNQSNSNFIVTGVSNVVNDSSASIIGGAGNNVYSMDSIVSGTNNTVSPKESSTSAGNIVGGSHNTVRVGNSLVVGEYLNSEKQDCSVLGEYNIDTANSEFIVGCGKSESTRLNGLRVSTSGDVYGNSAFSSTGADAAEWFEWEDGNANKEDRRGLFVTLEGDKIVLADENTTYIHGIISACPSFVGNTSEDYWNNKFMKDVFGEVLYEEVTVPEETITLFSDKGVEETVVIRESHIEKRPILNPDFDPTKEYVPRSKRPEWSYVSCWGRLVVVDDGTCVPNGYCRPKKGGIATASETGFRVMKRVDDTHILVWTDGAITIK